MDPLTVAGVAAVAVVSITTHEASHGFVADRLGDPTAREMGRLTLNPLPHIDLFLTILLPLVLIVSGTGFIFGGAKPVPVNVARLRNPRRDWALVGAAGPLANLAIALLLSVLLSLASRAGVVPSSPLVRTLAIGIFLNVLLAVFNLLPIPPLDGSRVVQYVLPDGALRVYRQIERVGLLLILALVFFFRPLQSFLVDAVVVCTAMITAPLGVWRDVAPVLRSALFS